jgi:hypothetical protein
MQVVKLRPAKIGNYQRPVYWILKDNGKLSLEYIEADYLKEFTEQVTANGATVEIVE